MNTFSNIAFNISDLPKLEELSYNPLNKKYLTVSMIYRAVVFAPLIGAIVINYMKTIPYFMIILGVTSVIILLLFILGYFSFFKKGYALREKDVSYKSGLIFHKITTVPLNRIQHTEVVREPVSRMFGLAAVKIYTAGGATSDIVIPGIEAEKAEQIREFINDKIKTDDAE